MTDNTDTSPDTVTPAPQPGPPPDAPAFDPSLPLSGDNKKWGTYDEIADFLTDSGSGRYLKDGEWVVINQDIKTGDTLTVDITRLTFWNKPAMRWALEAWTDVTGIQFRYVEGEERLVDGVTRYFIDDDNEVALTFTSNEDDFNIGGATVNVPPLDGTRVPASGQVASYIHEIGHVLGLGHPGPYGFYDTDGTFVFDGFASAIFLNDSSLLSKMSYFSVASNPWVTGSEYSNSVTPMIVDIIAVHKIFGAPTTIRAGDTVYGVGGNVEGYMGEVFDVWSNRLPVHFNNVSTGTNGLSLVDLDSDGDLDLIISLWSTSQLTSTYLENTGTPATPAFTERLNTDNPLVRDNIVVFGSISAGDMDGDGDVDLVSFGRGIRYIENTGTSTAPVFTEHFGEDNPFSSLTLNNALHTPTLVDLDGDGDQDLVLLSNTRSDEESSSTLQYFENTGTSETPVFTERLGTDNPLNPLLFNEGELNDWTAFADMDGDGDMDAFVRAGLLKEDDEGNTFIAGHSVRYYENTGTPTSPSFVEYTDTAYPFITASTHLKQPLALGDLDGDGDADLIKTDSVITGSRGVTVGDGYVEHTSETLLRYHLNSGQRDEIHFTDDHSNNPNIRLTLYDNGGIDTLKLSTDVFDQHLDLRPEGISSVYGLVNNIIIARDTVIEHAVAGMGDDTIIGNDVANRLEGRAGDDVLEGGAGADTLDGGVGNDTASYANSDTRVDVRLSGTVVNYGHATGDTLTSIENLIGSDYNDILAGNGQSNVLTGNAGNDLLWASSGDDTLTGGPGADRLVGGNGSDTASWTDSPTGITVRLHTFVATGGHAEGDTFPNTNDVTWMDADGTTHTETLPDVENLNGTAHDDILAGDRRDNMLNGGSGDDTLYGGPGGGDDVMRGGPGSDKLYGGQGDDTLVGNTGNDRFIGGPGADTFVFAPGGGDDVVADFAADTDRLDLTAFGLDDINDLTMTSGDDGVTIDLTDMDGGTILLADVTTLPDVGDFLV